MAGGEDQEIWQDVTPGPVITGALKKNAVAPKSDDAEVWQDANPASQTMAAGSYQTKPGAQIENVNTPKPPTPLERFAEVTTGSRHPLHDTAVDLGQWKDNPVQKAKELADATWRVIPRTVEAVGTHPLETAKQITGGNQFSEDISAGRYGASAADLAGGITNTVGAVALGGPESMRATGDLGAAALSQVGDVAGKGMEIVSPSTPLKARNLYERGVVPSGMPAEDQALMRENLERAQKYIAPETRGFPIKQGEGGTMRSAQIAHRAGDNLWDRDVGPLIDTFKDVQRPGSTIAGSIRDTFTELDKQTKPGAVKAGEDLARFFDEKTLTVGQMNDFVTQLNNDKAVSRFYDMSPNEQVAAELADPSLRAKVATVQGLRQQMFDAIGETGGEQLGEGFREARKDWGALRSVENQVRGARVPTPQPWWTKAANTIRGSLSPKGTDFWLRGSDTLFDFNNPDRLIPKAFNTLGKTDLQPPVVTPGRLPIGGVPGRLLPENAGPRGTGDPTAGNGVPSSTPGAAGSMEHGTAADTIPIQPTSTRVVQGTSAGPGQGPLADVKNSRGAASTIKPRQGKVVNVAGTPPTDALATQPPGTMAQTLGRPPYMPGPPIDAEFADLPRDAEGTTVLPSSGRTIITPRPAVEIMPELPMLNAGPPEAPGAPQLRNGLPARFLPPPNPRHPITGAIQLEPSSAPPETGAAPPAAKPKVPVVPEAPGGAAAQKPIATDRRSPANSAERARVANMSPEEMRQELLTSQTTGLPNKRAFNEAGKSGAVGMSDADGLKALNDTHGYEAGNALLKAKADALKEAGLDAYHDKGDEFLFRGDDPKELKDKLEKARDILRNKKIYFTGPDGETVAFKGADFSYGADTELSGAEKGLKENKAEREARGERARGELRGIVEVGPEKVQVSKGGPNRKEIALAKLEERPAPAKTPRAREPREELDKFDDQTAEHAKLQVDALKEMWGSSERPGRYFSDAMDEGNKTVGFRELTHTVGSSRPALEAEFPWLKNLPKMTEGKLRAAVESGKGVEYTRLLNEAGRHIVRMNEYAKPVLDEVGPELEEAAKSVDTDEPELAKTLRDIAAGKWNTVKNLRKFIKENLDAAKAFDTSIFEAESEEVSRSASGSSESSGGASEEEKPQPVELGPQKTIPGLESAVAENKKQAAVELGRKLTDKINEPAKSIESAAGEMETLSPLFRGSAASPQNEMFRPGGNPTEPTTAEYEQQAHDYREQVRNHEKVSPNKYATFQKQEETSPRNAKQRAQFWKRVLGQL